MRAATEGDAMGELRKARVLPSPTPETQRFWEGTKQHELWLQQCQDCQKFYFYPRPLCPRCLSANTEWKKASGRAKLHTYVINHRPPPTWPGSVPYVIAVVELEEGPRMMTNVVGIEPDPEKLQCDMPLEVTWEDVNEEITLPLFKPAG